MSEESTSGAWKQFLDGKRALLAEYAQAKEHAKTLPVQTHHGNVGEAQFRAWLESFLPKQYGVTSGYIRSQLVDIPHGTSHFDVIIYDQLQAPILWTERNPDKSVGGRSRIIPTEFVRAVIEIKSQLTTETARKAFRKLSELESVMADIDLPETRYTKFLPTNVVLAMVFIEVLDRNRAHTQALQEVMAAAQLKRPFYGALLLSGEGLNPNATGLTKLLRGDPGAKPLTPHGDLLSNVCITSWPAGGPQYSILLDWMDTNFATFAFDVLAIMGGTYEQGRVSSFFGLDLTAFKNPSELGSDRT